MAKKNWIYVKRGLSENPKHRAQMGECIWLYLHIIDRADWETGIAYDWKDEQEAADMGMPVRTLREQRRKLDEQGYINCKQRQYAQDIVITKWVNPRDYSGKVLNEGGNETSPEENTQGYTQGYTQGDTQGSTQDVTPTSNSISKSLTPKGDLVDLELSKLPAISLRQAISEYFKLNVNWETKTARQWMEWAVQEGVTAAQIASAANTWRMDKQFNWQVPTLKGIFEKWQMLMDASAMNETIPQREEGRSSGYYA
jgi:hypothetical protein